MGGEARRTVLARPAERGARGGAAFGDDGAVPVLPRGLTFLNRRGAGDERPAEHGRSSDRGLRSDGFEGGHGDASG